MKFTSILVIGLIIIGAGYEINSKIVKTPLSNNSSDYPEKEEVEYGLPKHLNIPKIKVDAIIEQVGLTADQLMGVPKEIANAAWFNLGPRPGENGTAVIDGHFGWRGKLAVFDDLYKLERGDKVYVEDENGLRTTFIVREIKTFKENDYPLEVFNSKDNKPHLNLITCEGVWNKGEKSYSNRLVVFTDKVME